MKKLTAFPIVGLIASCLVIILNLIVFIDFQLNQTRTPWVSILNSFTPLMIICIFLSFRSILITFSNLDNFKIIIYLFIVFKFLSYIITWIIKLKIITTDLIAITLTITGLITIALYIWFFISIFLIKKEQLKALTFLQIYAISLLLFIAFSFVFPFILKKDISYYGNNISDNVSFFQTLGGIPYIFLIFFFLKNLKISDDSMIKLTNA